MHDIDRTQLESQSESGVFEYEQFEMPGEYGEVFGEVFNEAELMELATELMEVGNEQELNYFLGNLIRRAAGAVGKTVFSPLGQALGGVLKNAARSAASQALPLIGSAISSKIGGRAGPAIGNAFSQIAGSALGLEAELLNQEDREFEGAKQYVRLVGSTVNHAVNASSGTDPRAIAQAAVANAARKLAPALLHATAPAAAAVAAAAALPAGGVVRGRGGRWIRRGSKIVLFGV